MKTLLPARQLSGFIARFDPKNARLIHAVHKAMRSRLHGAHEMVYDQYNFLVIGFGPTERPSEAILSITAYARGVKLCFFHGAKFKDPHGLLRGSGKQVRTIVVKDAADLRRPAVEALISQALVHAGWKIPRSGRNILVIRAILAKTRPRRLPAKS
jgi:hypothetical protein